MHIYHKVAIWHLMQAWARFALQCFSFTVGADTMASATLFTVDADRMASVTLFTAGVDTMGMGTVLPAGLSTLGVFIELPGLEHD